MARDPLEVSGSDRQGARERAFRLLVVTVTALFLAFAALGGGFLWYDSAAAWVTHTHQVRSGISDVLLNLTRAESAQRAYLLSGRQVFLDQVASARTEAEADLDTVAALTQDNPEQQARVAGLRTQMARRLAIIDQTIVMRQQGLSNEAVQMVLRGQGLAAMTAVTGLVSDLDKAEATLETQRIARAKTLRILIVTGLAGFAMLLSVMFIKAMRDLNLDREIEAATVERLRVLVRDRTLLVDEVNHRVKNSLQQIASVVRLQSRAVVDPAAREALDKTLDRIMAVGRVHEQLYKDGGKIGVFDAGAYAEHLARDLVGSMGRDDIVLETELESAHLDLRQAVPLALILNELITNALKYGCLPDTPSKICVGFNTVGPNYRLSVADTGAGLPHGFDLTKAKSLGMRAIEALARQLGGGLVVEESETGAVFAVVFPRSAA